MTFCRPQTLRPRGAANNEKPDARGRGLPEAFKGVQSGAAASFNRIARAFFAVALFWAPLGAFAHVLPTSDDVGFLNAGGVKTPGSIEVKP